MPTILEETPEFPDLIAGADAVLVGRFVEVVDEESDLIDDETERTISTARFRVENSLKGADDLDHVDVRLVPELVAQFSKKHEGRVLLALSREPSIRDKGPRFVPYFSSVLPVDDDGRLQPPKRVRQDAPERPESIEEVESLLDRLRKKAELALEAGYEAGEDHVDKADAREDEIGEMPDLALRDLSSGAFADLEGADVDGLQSTTPIDDEPAD